MDEKQKRLRTHVVKEIVETERVYCEQIRFVTEVGGPYVMRAGRVVHVVGVVGSLAIDAGSSGWTDGRMDLIVCRYVRAGCTCGELAVRLVRRTDCRAGSSKVAILYGRKGSIYRANLYS